MKNIVMMLLVLFSSHVHAKSLRFKWDRETKITFDSKTFASGRLDIHGGEIGSLDKTLFNAWRQYERTYRGYAFYELLDVIYGKEWRKAHKVTFVSADGYRQTVTIDEMLKASEKKYGYIAFTETGKTGFSKFRRGKRIIDPESFYLVWSGFARGHQAKHSDPLKWPFQLRTIRISSEESAR